MSLLSLHSELESAYRRTLSEEQIARMEAKWKKKLSSIPWCVQREIELYPKVVKALGTGED